MTLRVKASILIAVIITGALGITGVIHLRYFENSLKKSVLEGLASIGNTSSQVVSRFLADTLGEADAIALSLPKEALVRKDIQVIEDKLKAYAEKFPKFENGLFVLDKEGRLWVDYPVHAEQRGNSFAFREYFRRTMDEKKAVIGVPYRSARTGKPVLTFTAPLSDPSGTIIGLLGCSVQLTSPRALEGIRVARIGKTGYLYVYSRDRLMILHPEDERILKRDVAPGANRLFDAAIQGFEGTGETVNSRRIPMLVSFTQIPGTDWILGAQQPRAEAFSPIFEAKGRILASILLGIFLAVIVAAVTITGFTRPLQKLRKAVLLFGAAEQNRVTHREEEREYLKELDGINPGGEIGDLTRAFLGLSEQLDQTMRFLKNSARDWEHTFDSVSEAIIIVDREGRVIRMNRAAKYMLETEYSEGIGRSITDLLKGAKVTGIPPENGNNPHAEEPGFRLEMERAGRRFILEVTLTPLAGESDRPTGTVLAAKDITARVQGLEEKRRLEAQLQQAQKMEAIGTLAGGIAHNFNNLLMGIQGNASLLLLDASPGQPNRERAQNIEKLVQSGARLTTQLLGYAREGRFQSRPLSLNLLIREISETIAMARKDIRVEHDLGEDVRPVLADQGQFEQVLLNLFVNAVDAMPNGGTLFLSTENFTERGSRLKPYEVKPGDYVLLTVRDTGVGMDPKTLERIFEPFFTTKPVGKGTGLGLASVYGIVKAHGGSIDVESEKGGGTVFRIYLPACGEVPIEKGRPVSSGVSHGHEKVLLVDDEEMVLDVGRRILDRMGYRVSVARSGKEAIEVYGREGASIDLVLLDMIMPDMCGGDAFDHLKQLNPGVKVLLSSGYSIDGQAGEILRRGCQGFIQKPFNIEQLSRKIRDILGHSEAGCLS